MRAMKRGLSLQLALFAAAGLAILAGASFNIQGYTGERALIALLAGILAWAAGVLHRQWKIAVSLGLAALALTAAEAHFSGAQLFGENLAGLLCLILGGVISFVAYDRLTGELRQRLHDVQVMNRELEDQHRMFLAATDIATVDYSDLTALSASTARQVGAGFCVYYLAAEGGQFVPQLPGAGFAGSTPQTLIPRPEGDPLILGLAGNNDYHAADRQHLSLVTRLFSGGMAVESVLVEPMVMGDRLAGFIVLGNKPGGFDRDDRRLASTLAVRAAIHFGSQRVVTQTKEELARYSVLNEIAKQASGLPFEEVMSLVVERAKELVAYDSCRVVTFEPNGEYQTIGGGAHGQIEGSVFAEVKASGKVVIRRLVQKADGVLSGLELTTDSSQVGEAIAPITGRDGVFGAFCLGRKGGLGFGDKDIPSLQELGALAGVAVENSRILQKVAGQAVKVSTALDSLSEISEALTTTTKGTAALEQKTLEVATRLAGGTHALLCRCSGESTVTVINQLGFPAGVLQMQISNGQGVVGAVMLSRGPVAVADVADSFDLAAPPDLAAAGLHGALGVPIVHQGTMWGVLAVFTPERKEWSEDDRRVLTTLGNQAVVALQNAELYERSQKTVWEVTTLIEGLTAVTSTIDLGQVLQEVLVSAAKACGAQIAALALEQDGTLQIAAAFGTDSETARRLALELGGQICDRVFNSGQPVMHQAEKAEASAGPLDPRAVLCVPLMLRGKPIGVAFLANYVQGQGFSEDHQRVVTELAAQASVAIDNARLFNDRESLMLESLRAMAQLVDAKDPYTAGHSDRVTEYALIIARELKWADGDENAWLRFERGCRLHDIGKINVPDVVLSKPGRLTDEEYELLKKHPVVGYDVLKNLHMLTDELVVVRSHHERFDGDGYPDGKHGDELPMTAWMAAGADAFDAMTSDRPYRKGMSIEVALAEIVKGRGSQFHPSVSDAMETAIRQGRLKIIPQVSLYRDAPALGAFENPVR